MRQPGSSGGIASSTPMGVVRALLATAVLGIGCAERGTSPAGGGRAAGGRGAGAGVGAVETAGRLPIVTECPEMPVRTRDGLLRATPAAAGRALDDARSVLREQIARYPDRFLRLIGLKEVVLCDTLSFDGADCGAFADVERGRLYLQFRGAVPAGRLRRTIHHEVFHQVDYADDHRLDADARWEALNPPGFRYSNDALRVQANPDALVPDSSLPGFVTLYATSSVAEDKAEVHGLMMADPALVRTRAADDPVVRAKVDRIRTILERLDPTGRLLPRA